MRHRVTPAVILSAMLASVNAGAAESVVESAGCGHTVESVPHTVQTIVTPAYAGAAGVNLKDVARQMEILMLEAGHCQALTQSFENKSKDKEAQLTEWHSLNQWLYRLANFLGLNSRGDVSIDWREEYKLFAEVYELSI